MIWSGGLMIWIWSKLLEIQLFEFILKRENILQKKAFRSAKKAKCFSLVHDDYRYFFHYSLWNSLKMMQEVPSFDNWMLHWNESEVAPVPLPMKQPVLCFRFSRNMVTTYISKRYFPPHFVQWKIIRLFNY